MTQAVTIAPCTIPLRDWFREQATVISAFGTDTALAVPAFYAGGIPATAAWPAAAMFRVGGAPDGPLDRPLFQFDVVGDLRSGDAAETAAAVLISLLESTPASTPLAADLHFMGASVESALWSPDPGTDQPRIVITSEITVKAVP